jgi:hypothetical protein
MWSAADPSRLLHLELLRRSQRRMTILMSSAMLSFPAVVFAMITGPPLILYAWTAIVLLVPAIQAVMGRGYRKSRFGFWIEVEAFNPTRVLLPVLLSTAVAIGALLVVLSLTLKVPLLQLMVAMSPMVAIVPFLFVIIPLANRLRRRWYGRMVLRYVRAPLPRTEEQIRQSLATSGTSFVFDPKGRLGPFRGRTFELESGTRVMLIRGPRFAETRLFATLSVPLEQSVASNQERLVNQALKDLDQTSSEDKGL